MRKSFATLALAAAVVLPAAGAMTVAAGTAHAQKTQFERVKPHVAARINRHQIRPNFTARRCYLPTRWLYVNARQRVLNIGYRNVRYAGSYRGGHCTQVIRLTACRGYRRILISARYRFGRYAGMRQRYSGYCRPYRHHGPNRFKAS